MIVNRLAWVALVSVILLVLVGATVRVTGSGLGCPDWPFCWGCLIPPTNKSQIDVAKLDLKKFQRQAIRQGIDPDTITRETILNNFDPVKTWIEFGNRLTSLPLGLATLMLALFSLRSKRHRRWIVLLAWLSLLDVLVNAIMGAIVVRSGLQPGIITLHMGLAFLLIGMLVTVIWLSRPTPGLETAISSVEKRRLLIISLVFFTCLFGEGLLGSQLREQTDELALIGENLTRDQWVIELGATLIYKIHRSFSWTLLIASGLLFYRVSRLKHPSMPEPKFILGLIIAMMLMGVILGHISVFPIVQVFHVGTTAVLLAVTWHWIVRLWSTGCFGSTLS